MKVFKGIISVFLLIMISIATIILVGIMTVQDTLDLKTRGIFFENVYAEELTVEQLTKIESLTPELIHKYADEELDKRGIPRDALDYVLEEDNYVAIFEEFKQECIEYLAGEREKPVLPTTRINAMVDSGIAKYNEENNTSIKVDDVKENIEQITDKVDEQVQKLGENKSVKDIFKIFKSRTINYICIAIIIICACVLVLVNRSLLASLYLGISSLISGISLLILKKILDIDNEVINIAKEFLSSELGNIKDKFGSMSILFIILGVILIIIYIILSVLKKKKNQIA